MGYIVAGSLGVGLLLGFIFSLLYFSFDAAWKKVLSLLFTATPGGYSIFSIYDKLGISDYKNVFFAIGIFSVAFIATVGLMMFIMCRFLKKNDLNHQIGLTDIFFGNAKCLQDYYKNRKREIDDDLNINKLKERLESVRTQEHQLKTKDSELKRQFSDLRSLGNDKLKIELPVDKEFFVTDDFLKNIPGFVDSLSNCICGMNANANSFSDKLNTFSANERYDQLRSFLVAISLQIIASFFGKDSNEVRVHFRYYDAKAKGYKALVAVTGKGLSVRDLTFIPENANSMIAQSYAAKRALIKSQNPEFDYPSRNTQRWPEYITYTFPYLYEENMPFLSFGISFKNDVKYRLLLSFLNFCKFEFFLSDALELIGDSVIKEILYPNNEGE